MIDPTHRENEHERNDITAIDTSDFSDLPIHETSVLLQPLTAALLECVTASDVVKAILDRGMTVLGAEAGLVVLIQEDKENGEKDLDIVGSRGYSDEVMVAWKRFSLADALPLSDAVRERTALFSTGRADMEARYPAMFQRGPTHTVKASTSLPLVARGSVFGGLHFSFPEERNEFTESDRRFLQELAYQCALALDRAFLLTDLEEARASAEASQARLEFLSRASVLLAESLDYQRTLNAVAYLAVPNLCEWAAVTMVDTANENGPLLNLAVAHVNPAEVAWVREAQGRYPVNMTQMDQLVVQAISTGKTIFLPSIPEEVVLAAARDEEHLSLIRRLDLHSFLCVPLSARGKNLGAVIFATTRASGHVFTNETVDLVEELARRAAIAVDNALVVAELEQVNARQKQSLYQSEERFRLLVEGVQDYAIYLLDPKGRITTWNAGAERFKGYKAVEIIGQHFSRFYTEEDIARRHPWTELEVATREGRYEEEGWRVRKDGSRFWANVVITALRTDKGELYGFAKVTRDVTEHRLRERERAVAEAVEQQRRFLKDILASVTQGRLVLCDDADELPTPSSSVTYGAPILLSGKTLKGVRARVEEVASLCGLPNDRSQGVITAASECAMNAVQHAGGGSAQIYGDAEAGLVQVWIEDMGRGIDLSNLPRATLEPGFSTGGGGIGHGFSLMIACSHRVYLLTGASGTTVVLEQTRHAAEPAWLQSFG